MALWIDNNNAMNNETIHILISFSPYISDSKYAEYFERAYAFVDDTTFGRTWTMGEIKTTLSEYDVRSVIECGILCKRNSACVAWQFQIMGETIGCSHLSSYLWCIHLKKK